MGGEPYIKAANWTGQQEQKTNANRYQCLEWYSNQRSQCLGGRRHSMPQTAWPRCLKFKDNKLIHYYSLIYNLTKKIFIPDLIVNLLAIKSECYNKKTEDDASRKDFGVLKAAKRHNLDHPLSSDYQEMDGFRFLGLSSSALFYIRSIALKECQTAALVQDTVWRNMFP
jgi:hypothetical protein